MPIHEIEKEVTCPVCGQIFDCYIEFPNDSHELHPRGTEERIAEIRKLANILLQNNPLHHDGDAEDYDIQERIIALCDNTAELENIETVMRKGE